MKISRIQRDVLIRLIDGEVLEVLPVNSYKNGMARWRETFHIVHDGTFKSLLRNNLVVLRDVGGAAIAHPTTLGVRAVAEWFFNRISEHAPPENTEAP